MAESKWRPVDEVAVELLAIDPENTIETLARIYGLRAKVPKERIGALISAFETAEKSLNLEPKRQVLVSKAKTVLGDQLNEPVAKPRFKKGDIVRLARITKEHASWGWEQYIGAFGEITSGPTKQANIERHVLEGQMVQGDAYSVNLCLPGKVMHFNPVFDEELEVESSQEARLAVASI